MATIEGTGVECPTCARDDFDTVRAMKYHHSVAHGESIAGEKHTCENCGDEYRVEPNKSSFTTYCSDTCSTEAQKARVEIVCERCGDVFEVEENRQDTAKYCSRECVKDQRELTCEQCGEKYTVDACRADESKYCSRSCLGKAGKGVRTAEYYDIECGWCGEIFERVESEKEREFCSVECKSNWQSQFTGSDHWSWRGGHTLIEGVKSELTPTFSQVRDEVRASECEICGKTKEDVGRALDVHHIIPIRSGGTNGKWNLMTLCPSCHHTAENYCREYPGFEALLAK